MEVVTLEKKPVEKKPQVVIGVVPCLNHLFLDPAWETIGEYVEELSRASDGEYTAYQVYESLFCGRSHLFIAYLNTTDMVTPDNMQVLALKHLQEKKKDFIGYMILRYEHDSVHIWQGFIAPEYRHTNLPGYAFQFVEDEARRIKAPYITFSSPRAGWGEVCKAAGYKEMYSIYRKRVE